mgnify:CR=1 FL=1
MLEAMESALLQGHSGRVPQRGCGAQVKVVSGRYTSRSKMNRAVVSATRNRPGLRARLQDLPASDLYASRATGDGMSAQGDGKRIVQLRVRDERAA